MEQLASAAAADDAAMQRAPLAAAAAGAHVRGAWTSNLDTALRLGVEMCGPADFASISARFLPGYRQGRNMRVCHHCHLGADRTGPAPAVRHVCTHECHNLI